MTNRFLRLKSLSAFAAVMVITACQPNSSSDGAAELVSPQNDSKLERLKIATEAIDTQRLVNADANPGDWLTYGRNYAEDRYTPLDQIGKDNLDDLGLAWSLELGTKRGIQATPIVVDGIMYFTGPWSVVYAVDASNGERLWTFDPQVPRKKAKDMCCGVVNRGVAIYEGAIFVGTMDGRLISVDAATGEQNWSAATFDPDTNYSITGAPRIANGKVVIGNGGAEFGGTRGFVTAYDAKTGEEVWRFYTVPGNPAEPFENPILEMAAETWTGEWWKQGGGGTAWDAIVYDPEFNAVYIGVGNGSHWNREIRSPDGGDNLFLSSIVAVDADTGEYRWHYQTTPGDTWDYTATQPLIQAELEIEGELRKVLMQAPKNGFFYIIDRENGELISGEPFSYTNWAKSLDENGRPVEEPGARYLDGKTHWITPSSHGAHNWHPMSYNYETGLVYIPGVVESGPFAMSDNVPNLAPGGVAPGSEYVASFAIAAFNDQVVDPDAPPPGVRSGELIAYDPVKQKRVWSVPRSHHYNSGILSTTTGLVMQAESDGWLSIHDATTGALLRQFDVRAGAISPPISYLVNGEQHITLLVGWGAGQGQTSKTADGVYPGTVYTFKLGGEAAMPKRTPEPEHSLLTLTTNASEIDLGWGFTHNFQACVGCHGLPGSNTGGALPNLAYSDDATIEALESILLDGALAELGMPIHDHYTKQEVKQLQSYIIFMAQSMREGQTWAEAHQKVAGYQKLAWEAGMPAPAPETPAQDAEPFEDGVEVTKGDPVQGERAARVCSSCHSFDKGGRDLIGPNLWNIVGKDIASTEGVRYSNALKSIDGVWTVEQLDSFLKDPRKFAPGTTMGIGAAREETRADIIAYLETLNE